jgi:hypothetical protein
MAALRHDIRTLADLSACLADGRFHHATYRDLNTIWEGLYVYLREDNGFNGFTVGGCFGKSNPDLDAAHELVRHTGVSLGARGEG